MMTESLISALGPRSIETRTQLVKSGDKARVNALRKALISIGACKINIDDAKELGYRIVKHRFSFMLPSLTFALIPEADWQEADIITSPIKLELAHIQNGVIGLKTRPL